MKLWLPLLLATLLPALHAESVQDALNRGLRAYKAGNFEEAQMAFSEVVAADPKNAMATAYLRRLQVTQAAGQNLQKKLASLMIPKVDFKDASLSSVVAYLPKMATEQSGGKVVLNIVPQYPPEFAARKVTLQLSNVPMTSVLEYLAQLTGLRVSYQPSAVVLSPSS